MPVDGRMCARRRARSRAKVVYTVCMCVCRVYIGVYTRGRFYIELARGLYQLCGNEHGDVRGESTILSSIQAAERLLPIVPIPIYRLRNSHSSLFPRRTLTRVSCTMRARLFAIDCSPRVYLKSIGSGEGGFRAVVGET